MCHGIDQTVAFLFEMRIAFVALLLLSILHADWDADDMNELTDCINDVDTQTKIDYPAGFSIYCYLRVGAGPAWDAAFSFALIAFIIQLVALVCVFLAKFVGKSIIFTCLFD